MIPSAISRARWLDEVAAEFCALERDARLPEVSSALSGVVTALGGAVGQSDLSPALVRRGITAIAAAYAPLLAEVLPALANDSSRPLRIVSLCTGYDAIAELFTFAVLGRVIERYTSVDIDPRAADANHRLVAPSPWATCSRFLVGDLAEVDVVAAALADERPIDLLLALRPPIFATRYGDTRRAGPGGSLAETVHCPVALPMLALREEIAADTPLCVLTYFEDERDELHRLLRAVGLCSWKSTTQASLTGVDRAAPIILRALIVSPNPNSEAQAQNPHEMRNHAHP
jgi:hypothetical protein